MRKIISILVAVGLLLAFSAVAMPTAAQTPCATVSVADGTICAGGTDVFTINIASLPATLLAVNDMLSVEFGTGATFGTFVAGDITVGGSNVDVTKVVKTGSKLVFPTPITITAGTAVAIVVAKVTNPATAGEYDLKLDYKLSCCAEVVFCTIKYTVVPAKSTYGFFWDSGPTYPGISPDFVPPFKACGQNISGAFDMGGGAFANLFDLILKPTLIGCAGPCAADVVVTLWVSAAPTGAKISLGLNSTGAITHNLTAANNATNPVAIGNYTLGANTTITWDNIIHFDTVGQYTICVKAFCPPGAAVCPDCDPQGSTVAERCFNIDVKQWKDVGKIILDEKWNLISLPLVPFNTSIDSLLASLPAAVKANILSIWNYDRCTDKWFTWGNGQSSLTTMVDGDAYWMRLKYPLTNCGNFTWYVWGTEKPMPPAAPAQYPVCAGWNMVGFTSLTDYLANDYLWNWTAPVVYGWDHGCWTLQTWDLINFATDNLESGQGYWVAFPTAGAIYVP